MPPGGQTRNHMVAQFGLQVAVTQGYMCTKFELNSISHYKTCLLYLRVVPTKHFDLEMKVESKTRRICDVPLLEVPTIFFSDFSNQY